jgi:hypothetical protein
MKNKCLNCPIRPKRDTQTPLLLLTILIAIGIAAAFACIGGGCASTPQGLTTEQHIYKDATNAVSAIQQFLPYVPAPIATPAEVFLGLLSIGLGAWNMHQQKSISQLQNGQCPLGGVLPPPRPPGPQATAPGSPPSTVGQQSGSPAS